VPIGAAKERLILVLLALNVGRVVPIDRLVDVVWGEDPPESASVSLRVLVSRLRKTLAAAGCPDVIRTQSPGYLLAADVVELDVDRFESLAIQGRGQLAGTAAAEASVTLRQAFALWRGDRLAESSELRLIGEAARLAEARLAVLEARIDADMTCGRHAELVPELQQLCRAHPLRERLWAQRMLALYRCGRQADALAAYQELRTTLADELGLDPGGELRALERAILAQDPALSAPPAGAGESPRSLDARPDRRSEGADFPVPLPAPLDLPETVACIGRDGELDELRTMWQRVLGGRARMVLVSGEAGAGKSRLVREFARQVHRRGALVLHGHCDEDLAVPFRPFRECLAHYVLSVSEGRLADHNQQWLASITRLVPELARRTTQLPDPTRSDPDVERYLLFGAVAGLFGEIASTAPVVLVLDDLHWADAPTLQLVRHFAGAVLGRVMVLGTYRDGELVAGQPIHAALAALCREPTFGNIRLEGLAESAVAAVIAAMVGGALDPTGLQLARDLARATDGNAFLVVEEARHLRETGTLIQVDDARATAVTDLGSAGLPHTVKQVVTARLGQLDETAGTAVSVASVIGEQFDLELVSAATDVDEDQVLNGLEAAAHRALVTEAPAPPGSFRFAHAMIRQVIYHGLGPTRQARLHRRIGKALEGLCGQEPGERAGELARHFLLALPRDVAKAARYARLAGERALATLAPDEAVGWFGRAIEALNDVDEEERERVRCLVGLGDAQRQLRLPEARQTLLDAARKAGQLGEFDLQVRAALANNRGAFSLWGRVDAELVEMLEEALKVCPPGSPRRARLLSQLAAELTFHPDVARRRVVADEAVAVARASGDRAALLDALSRPYPALQIPEFSDLCLSRLHEAQGIADGVYDPIARFWVAHNLGLQLLERADADGTEHWWGRAEQIATTAGHPTLFERVSACRCLQALLVGDLQTADRLVTRKLDISVGQPSAVPYGETLAFVRWHQGRLDEIVPILTRIVTESPDSTSIRATLALAQALGGQPEQAQRLLRAAAETGFAQPRTAIWLVSMCTWAEVTAELRDHDAAPLLYAQLHPWGHLFATTGLVPLHAVAQSLGRLATVEGRRSDAEEHFAEALDVHRRMHAPFCIAATQLAWGQLLLPHDPDRARLLLTTGAAIATRHGYGYLQRSAEDCLDARCTEASEDHDEGVQRGFSASQ
jgi:DNA-binding SARP family transcriptional activator